MKRRLFLLAGLIALILAAPLTHGQTTFTWTGLGNTDDFYDGLNWAGDVAPPNDGSANIVFGNSRRTYLNYWEIDVNQLAFIGNSRSYSLHGDYETTLIGTGGIIYNPAQPVRSYINGSIEFTDDQTWNIVSGSLVLSGHIYDGDGGYTLTKTGAGALVFSYSDNAFDYATIHLNDGRLVLTAPYDSYGDRPLGWADLVIGPATGGANPTLVTVHGEYEYDDDSVTLDNAITLNGILATENRVELYLTDTVTLNADTTIKSTGAPLYIEGNIDEASATRNLTIDASGAVILTGANSYTGDTTVTNGVLIFGEASSIPQNNVIGGTSGKLVAAANGYIGFGDDTFAGNVQGKFIDHFDKANTQGTVGFDSDPDLVPNNFTGNIDLTAFASSARLGSATHAIISGLITPQGTDYRFGGGGGWLQVDSALSGIRGLVLDSPAELPLTLRLTNPGNNFSLGTSVSNSGVIFADGAMPTGTGNVAVSSGGYVGTEGTDINGFLTRINLTAAGVIGFDIAPGTAITREISSAIDLSAFTNGVYLGTASAVYDMYGDISAAGLRLTGTLTPGLDGHHRFAAYKGGALEVASLLSGAATKVYVGDPNSVGTFGNPQEEEISRVLLSGDNTYGGGTTLYTGQLRVGQSNGVVGTDPTTALGTGALIVQPHNLMLPGASEDDDLYPELSAHLPGLIIPNPVQLNADLYVTDENSLALSGPITGPGELYVGENTSLTLSGNNTFSGGVYLESTASLTLASNTATGSGTLGFGYSADSNVYIQVAAPIIHGLESRNQDDTGSIHLELDNTVLTVMQPAGLESTFRGNIHTDAYAGTARFVKDGSGTLRYDGNMDFEGIFDVARNVDISAEVRAGILVVSNSDYDPFYYYNTDRQLGYDKVLLNGGTLALDHNTSLTNAIIAESGRLAGHGSFKSDVSVGAGVTLAPGFAGFDSVGTLHFDHLELNSGGTYEWQIQDPGVNGQLGRDLIEVFGVYTLVLNATAAAPFTVKIITLNLADVAGELSGFDPSQSYSWVLFASDFISGFDPTKFSIDTTGFANSLAFNGQGNGTFSVSLSSAGMYNNLVMLNFTPVPEPSTYALMLLGLGFVGWTVWRRRR